MSDRPVDFEDDDLDLGEPVTDKLNVLLEEVYDEWGKEEEDVDLGEPVTDKLNNLLSALPEDWDGDALEPDLSGPVTDRLTEILRALPGEEPSTGVAPSAEPGTSTADEVATPRRGAATRLLEFAKALFGRGGGEGRRGD